MRKNMYRKCPVLLNKKLCITLFFILAIYFWVVLSDTLQTNSTVNAYDFLINIVGFHTLSFFIIPLFLILITSFFTVGSEHNYILFRFKSRREWYVTKVLSLAQITGGFCLIVMLTMIVQALFTFSFENNWSGFAENFYSDFSIFLANNSPLLTCIISFLLLWCILFSISLIFYIVFLYFNNALLSFGVGLLVNLLNVATSLGHITFLYPIMFVHRVSVFNYIYTFEIEQQNFPYSIFLYWIIFIVFLFFIGRILVNRVDIDSTKKEGVGKNG